MKKIPQSFQCRGSRGACLTMREVGTARCAVRTPQRGVPTSVRYVFALIFGLAAVSATSFAQTPDSVAEREVQRRQTAIPEGEAALARGKSAMKVKNYTLAHEEFKTAVTSLPDSVVSGKAHDQAVDGFCKSGVALAEARIAEGRNADAEVILSEILSDRYDPKCRPAHELYMRLRQPGSFDKNVRTVSSGEVDCAGKPALPFPERVERVKELLAEADSFHQSGQYDLAMKRYDQVLCLDPKTPPPGAVRKKPTTPDNSMAKKHTMRPHQARCGKAKEPCNNRVRNKAWPARQLE